METVELEAGPISYRSLGPEDGPVIVFVHGLLVDGSLWTETAEQLGQRGYRCIVPDWPLGSHRQAMDPDADLSPRGVARIVLDFIAELGFDQVTLVGNDTGGAICQFVIDTDPGPIQRLVLTNCDAFTTFPPAVFKPIFWLGRVPSLAWVLMQPTRWAFVRNRIAFGPLAASKFDSEQTRAWLQPFLYNRGVRRDVSKLARHVKAKDLEAVGSRLNRYDRPVLLCWGSKDPFFRSKLAHRLVAAFPDARLVEIPESRTYVSLDEPERLASEIAGFVPTTR